MAACGIPQTDICRVLGIAPHTLRKHYRKELDTAAPKANAMVAQCLFAQATRTDNPSIPAMIFWLKVRAGWTEKSIFEVVAKMSDAELEEKAVELLAGRSSGTE